MLGVGVASEQLMAGKVATPTDAPSGDLWFSEIQTSNLSGGVAGSHFDTNIGSASRSPKMLRIEV